jgi:chromosome segregation ATPase
MPRDDGIVVVLTGGLMLVEQLDRIETAVTRIESSVVEIKTDVAVLKTDVAVLKTDVAVLKTDVAVLKTDVAVLKTDVAGLKTDVAGLKTDVAGLKTDVGGLKADVARLDAGQIELRRHMLLLHEEALERIAAQGFPSQAGTTATKQDLRDLEERINRRLDPIEWAIKSHSTEIADLQRSRDAR